jgi:hypothetical protein
MYARPIELRVSIIFSANLKQASQERDGVTGQILHVVILKINCRHFFVKSCSLLPLADGVIA